MKASRLSSRFSTTIPRQVRKALNLAVGDAISYEILDERRVLMTRVDPSAPLPPSMAEQRPFQALGMISFLQKARIWLVSERISKPKQGR